MINELFSVYTGLENIGEKLQIKHNDIASPGMGTTFRVCLDLKGNVESLEILSKENIKDIWSIGNGNKNQFPAVKFEYPFIPEGNNEYNKWKKNHKKLDVKELRQQVNDLVEKYEIAVHKECWPSYRNKIIERKNQLEVLLNSSNEGKEILTLFERYLSSNKNGIGILEDVGEKLIQLSKNADLELLKIIAEALFGNILNNKGKINEDKRITLLIDCLPKSDIDIYSTSRRRLQTLSEAIFESEKANQKKTGICAITGKESEVVSTKYPEEKLSVVGNTIILAKNEGTSGPTVKRYYKSGTESYPLNKMISEKLAASLLFLTQKKYEGKTWKKIPSSTDKKSNLLIAYCKDRHDLIISPLITGFEVENFDDYSDATKTVLDLLGRSNCKPDDVVDILEIISIDKANRKVNYLQSTTINNLSKAANEWILACDNVPDFKLLAKIGNKTILANPWAIAPISSIKILKNKYIRNGVSSTQIKSVSISELMTIFLNLSDRVKPNATSLVAKLALQTKPLIEYCALSKLQVRLAKKSQIVASKPNKNSNALEITSLMAALLYKAKRKKEIYMNSFAYQLGQLCSALDELHIGYCQSVRSGNIPSALIGNTAFNLALNNPQKSLAVISMRIKPYKAWALKTRFSIKSTNDEAIKGGYYASVWISKQASEIIKHFENKGNLVNDTYKAELLLGYLAGRPFEKK